MLMKSVNSDMNHFILKISSSTYLMFSGSAAKKDGSTPKSSNCRWIFSDPTTDVLTDAGPAEDAAVAPSLLAASLLSASTSLPAADAPLPLVESTIVVVATLVATVTVLDTTSREVVTDEEEVTILVVTWGVVERLVTLDDTVTQKCVNNNMKHGISMMNSKQVAKFKLLHIDSHKAMFTVKCFYFFSWYREKAITQPAITCWKLNYWNTGTRSEMCS